MSRRHSSVFFALLGVPLIGVVLVHLPAPTVRAGFQRPLPVASGPIVAAAQQRLQAVPGSQPSVLHDEELAMAGTAAAPAGLGTTPQLSYAAGINARKETFGSGLLPLASIFVLFAAGGLLLLRRIARMMV